ncbi:acyl-CoA carboxylase epsilon subunit [Streptosporangium sp. NPDC023615]|uniref:acyl-CoA carboxylase epsilon subunit n=1 Tax=Streptosporangium sp. NPDC023615 TaxID=3154794 RepID=UPI0034395278
MNGPGITVLRGGPTDEELAAVVAVLLAAGARDARHRAADERPPGPRAAERAPWHRFRKGYVPPGAWTAGDRPTPP